MKKMINGKDVRFVADALVSAYRNRGYHVEGEEVTPPPSGNPEGQTAPEGNENGSGEVATDPEEEQSDSKFVCPVCGKEYTKQAYLDKHMADKHPEV